MIEMIKENLYNNENLMIYIKKIVNVLRRYKDNDNKCETEKNTI